METRMKFPVKQSVSFFMVFCLAGFLSGCLSSGSSQEKEVIAITDMDEIFMEDIFGEPTRRLEGIVTAIVKNDMAAFKALITPENINEVIPMGGQSEWPNVTPLAVAIEYGRNEMINYLLEMKADLTYVGEGGLPEKIQPLIVAASKNRADLVRSFTEKAADGRAGTFFPAPHKEYGKYVTPLEVACRAKNNEIETYLRWLGATEEDAKIRWKAEDSYYRVNRADWWVKRSSYSCLNPYGKIIAEGTPENTISTMSDPTFNLLIMLSMRDTSRYSLQDVRELVEKGADVNSFLTRRYNSDKRRHLSPLMVTAYRGQYDIVEYLIAQGADVNLANYNNETPLFMAIAGGNAEMVHLLLRRGATTDLPEEIFYSCLQEAILLNDLSVMQQLLDVDNQCFKQIHFLKALVALGRSEILDSVLKKDVKPDSIPGLFVTAIYEQRWDMVHWLFKNGANINWVEQEDLPVIDMAKKGYWSRVRYLLEQGADINSREKKDKTYLSLFQMAVEAGRSDIVLYMAERGADIERLLDKSAYTNWVAEPNDSKMADLLRKASEYHRKRSYSQNGYTHLHNATLLYGLDAVEDAFLLGIPVNSPDSAGNTPLHTLMLGTKEEKDFQPVIDFLIKNGARLNARNKEGKTPLYLAIEYNKPVSVVDYLIGLGADIEVPDQYGQTPLFAAVRKSPELLSLLLEKGANVNTHSFYRRITPLHLAVEMRNQNTLEKLVVHGADPALTDRFGNTPLELARNKGAGFMDMFVYLEGVTKK